MLASMATVADRVFILVACGSTVSRAKAEHRSSCQSVIMPLVAWHTDGAESSAQLFPALESLM